MNNWSVVTGQHPMPGAQFYSASPGIYMQPHMWDMQACAAQPPYITPMMSGAHLASASPELYMQPHMWDMRACAAQPFCTPWCLAAPQQNLLIPPEPHSRLEKGRDAKRQKRGKRKRQHTVDYDRTAEPPRSKHRYDFTAQPVEYDAITTPEGDIIFSQEILDLLGEIPGIWHLAEAMGFITLERIHLFHYYN